MKPTSISRNTLTDTQYLSYVIKRNKSAYEDYITFCESIQALSFRDVAHDLWENKSIDIIPYLYTVSQVTHDELDQFFRYTKFYFTHAEIESLELEKQLLSAYSTLSDSSSVDTCQRLIQVLQENDTTLIGILSIMQYYFL